MAFGPKKPTLKGTRRKAVPKPLEPGVAGPLQPGQVRKAGPRPPTRQEVNATTAARRTRAATGGTAPARPAGTPPPGGSAPRAAVAPATTATTPTTPANSDIETQARNTYGYMAWALDDPELGKVLRQAAAEGWDEARLKGAVFATNWFKTHGTAKVAASIKEQADAYLVPLSDQTRKQWAMKIITGEVQPTEMNDYLKEQAKSQRPWLAGAIDRGITVRQYADPYVQVAAKTLNLAPEAIDFADPKWSRAIDDVREDGTRAPMSLADWQNKLRTDGQYGFDFTPQARAEASAFAAKLQETFGARG